MPIKTLLDAYKVLEIHNSAIETEVKAAYKRLALLTHPDKNRDDPHAQEKFQRVSEAFQMIMDANFSSTYNFQAEDGDADDEDYDEEDFAFDLFNYMFSTPGASILFASLRNQMFSGGSASRLCNCIACRINSLNASASSSSQRPAQGANYQNNKPAAPETKHQNQTQTGVPPSQPRKQDTSSSAISRPADYDPHANWLSEDDAVRPAKIAASHKKSKKTKKALRKKRAAHKSGADIVPDVACIF
jgi:curved DNA-binding protein CbpA